MRDISSMNIQHHKNVSLVKVNQVKLHLFYQTQIQNDSDHMDCRHICGQCFEQHYTSSTTHIKKDKPVVCLFCSIKSQYPFY